MGILSGIIGNAGTIKPEELRKDYEPLLTDEESVEVGFKLVRDTFIFTDKRLIVVDKQGVTGRKTSYLSVPYSRISRFSVETAGHFDLDAELVIWIIGADEPIRRTFSRNVNVYDLQKLLASHVMG